MPDLSHLVALVLSYIALIMWGVIEFPIYKRIYGREKERLPVEPGAGGRARAAHAVMCRVTGLPEEVALAWAEELLQYGGRFAGRPSPRWAWVETQGTSSGDDRAGDEGRAGTDIRGGTVKFFGVDGKVAWIVERRKGDGRGVEKRIGHYARGDAVIVAREDGTVLVRSNVPDLPGELRFPNLAYFLLFAYLWELWSHSLQRQEEAASCPPDQQEE